MRSRPLKLRLWLNWFVTHLILQFHLLHKLLYSFSLGGSLHQPHSSIDKEVTNSTASSPLVKRVSNFSINTEAEVVTKTISDSKFFLPLTISKHLVFFVLIYFLEFSVLNILKPTSYTSAFTSQTSKSSIDATSHFLISFFRDLKLFSISTVFYLPQPKYCEKSFPVPNGSTPNGIFIGSMEYL